MVIGNPPYETIAKGQTAAQRRAERNRLRDNKQYQTTGGGDLYNLFCEVALTLVKQEDGVVTLVVPLSLAFGQDQSATRRLFELRSKSIRLRHQDNRPDKTFHESPVAHPENRQRTTIITAVTGNQPAVIETAGVGKWAKSEREQYLLHRQYARIPARMPGLHGNLASQWPRIPSIEVGQLIAAMLAQHRAIGNLAAPGENEYSIAFPQLSMSSLHPSLPDCCNAVKSISLWLDCQSWSWQWRPLMGTCLCLVASLGRHFPHQQLRIDHHNHPGLVAGRRRHQRPGAKAGAGTDRRHRSEKHCHQPFRNRRQHL